MLIDEMLYWDSLRKTKLINFASFFSFDEELEKPWKRSIHPHQKDRQGYRLKCLPKIQLIEDKSIMSPMQGQDSQIDDVCYGEQKDTFRCVLNRLTSEL